MELIKEKLNNDKNLVLIKLFCPLCSFYFEGYIPKGIIEENENIEEVIQENCYSCRLKIGSINRFFRLITTDSFFYIQHILENDIMNDLYYEDRLRGGYSMPSTITEYQKYNFANQLIKSGIHQYNFKYGVRFLTEEQKIYGAIKWEYRKK